MRPFVGVLAGLLLSGMAYAHDVTEEERREAVDRATSELIRSEVVDINEDLIRVRTITFDAEGRKSFISTSMSDLTQCGAFRAAQAKLHGQSGTADEAELYKQRSAYLETHLLLLAEAAGRVIGDPNLRADIKQELTETGPSWIKQHLAAITSDGAAEQERTAFWEGRCASMESMLSLQLDKRARNQITSDAIDERAEALLQIAHPDHAP